MEYPECFTHLVSLFCPGGINPEHRVSALSGDGGEQTVRVHFPAGHSGLHKSEMDHHKHIDCPASVNTVTPVAAWNSSLLMDEWASSGSSGEFCMKVQREMD